jgi:hypothetical protein
MLLAHGNASQGCSPLGWLLASLLPVCAVDANLCHVKSTSCVQGCQLISMCQVSCTCSVLVGLKMVDGLQCLHPRALSNWLSMLASCANILCE